MASLIPIIMQVAIITRISRMPLYAAGDCQSPVAKCIVGTCLANGLLG